MAFFLIRINQRQLVNRQHTPLSHDCKTGCTCFHLSPWQESDQGPIVALAEALTAGRRHVPERKHLAAIAVGAEITGEKVVVPHVSRHIRSATYTTRHAFVDEKDRPRICVVHLSEFIADILQNALSIISGPTPVMMVGNA